jgi:hypothetical protein
MPKNATSAFSVFLPTLPATSFQTRGVAFMGDDIGKADDEWVGGASETGSCTVCCHEM